MARQPKYEEEKNRLRDVRESLVTEYKWNQGLEESCVRDKDYVMAGHYQAVCLMLEKAIKLCGEEKPKEDKIES